jgi:hypothetical protein
MMELTMLFLTIAATVLFQLTLCFLGAYAKHAKA